MPRVGRGRNYGVARGWMEAALIPLFAGGWPARAARAAGQKAGVRVAHHAVGAPRWPEGARPLRIGFASDFHAGPTTHDAQLEAACLALADAQVDLLLLGGDYVLFDARRIERVAAAVASVPAPLGRLAVLGNHDLWADDARIVDALSRAGVEVLVNRPQRLAGDFAHVWIGGLDDPFTGAPDIGATFAETPPSATRVLLMHGPDGLLAAGDAPFDLAVCGHTHGGQIALPGGTAILAPGRLSRRYNHGRFDLDGGRTMIVSRGVGTGELPIRLFAAADVIVCDLGG